MITMTIRSSISVKPSSRRASAATWTYRSPSLGSGGHRLRRIVIRLSQEEFLAPPFRGISRLHSGDIRLGYEQTPLPGRSRSGRVHRATGDVGLLAVHRLVEAVARAAGVTIVTLSMFSPWSISFSGRTVMLAVVAVVGVVRLRRRHRRANIRIGRLLVGTITEAEIGRNCDRQQDADDHDDDQELDQRETFITLRASAATWTCSSPSLGLQDGRPLRTVFLVSSPDSAYPNPGDFAAELGSDFATGATVAPQVRERRHQVRHEFVSVLQAVEAIRLLRAGGSAGRHDDFALLLRSRRRWRRQRRRE